MRDHAADRAFDQQFRVARPASLGVLGFMSANEAGEAHESFLVFLFAGEPHLFRVDHDDEIAGVDMRSEDRFFFAAKKVRGLHGDLAEDLVLGVDNPPLAWDFVGFSGKRFHRERKGTETMGEAVGCQQDVRGDFER